MLPKQTFKRIILNFVRYPVSLRQPLLMLDVLIVEVSQVRQVTNLTAEKLRLILQFANLILYSVGNTTKLATSM